MRCGIYARVSTLGQEPENQLQELRQYVAARTWTGTEDVDRGVSGARTAARPSTSFWRTHADEKSTCCSVGGSIASGATCGIW